MLSVPRLIDGALAVGTVVAGVWSPATLAASVPACIGLHALAVSHPRFGWYGRVTWRMPWPDAIALTFDDGPHPEVTPRVLDLLADAGAQATFCVIGENVRRHPGLVRRMIAEGHSVAVHSDQHRWTFNLWGRVRLAADLTAAVTTISAACGVRPAWFRPPMGLRNPLVHAVAADCGLPILTWTVNARDARPAGRSLDPLQITRRLRPGAILVLHDGHEPWRRVERSRCQAIVSQVLAHARSQGWSCRAL
jgi:peptidoglycan/xylan/chitin deacetylase (PgdA/CDA1 family)